MSETTWQVVATACIVVSALAAAVTIALIADSPVQAYIAGLLTFLSVAVVRILVNQWAILARVEFVAGRVQAEADRSRTGWQSR